MKKRLAAGYVIYFTLCAVFVSCLLFPAAGKTARDNASAKQEAAPGDTRKIKNRAALIPSECTPGEPLTVIYAPAVKTESRPQAVLYNKSGKKSSQALFAEFPLENILEDENKSENETIYLAFITPSSLSAPGACKVCIEIDGEVLETLPLEIKARDFASETITLSKENTKLRAEPNPEKDKETARLWSIISGAGTEFYAASVFISPVAPDTRRSSFFGDRRLYKYSTGDDAVSVHAGIDFAVPRGTPVKACADGKVVLASPRIVTGKSIIIEHLPGVYSLYYHLDEIDVKEGDYVHAGDVIAKSGSTGFSTGPHLHWEIRIAGENSDPDAFTRRGLLDKTAISKALFPENNTGNNSTINTGAE